MVRKRPPNTTHTSPQRSGEDNFKGVDLPSDESGLMTKIMPMREEGKKAKQAYKGLWTAELLEDAIDRFFQYCTENDLKPTIPLLRVWLGVSKSQFNDWRANSSKYGDKSVLVEGAVDIMESFLQANIDKYPTGSAFLLRTSFGHVETSKVNVDTSQATTAEDVNEIISKLGLDKQ